MIRTVYVRKFSPTPGRLISVFIPNFDSKSWFPIPESSSNCGVCKEPRVQIILNLRFKKDDMDLWSPAEIITSFLTPLTTARLPPLTNSTPVALFCDFWSSSRVIYILVIDFKSFFYIPEVRHTFVTWASVSTRRFFLPMLGSRYAGVAYERLAVAGSIDAKDVMEPMFLPLL